MVSGAVRRKNCYTVHKQAGASRKHSPVSYNETTGNVPDTLREMCDDCEMRRKSARFEEVTRVVFAAKKMLKAEKEMLNFYKHC